MILEIRVISKDNEDSKGNEILAEIKRTLKIQTITKIRTAKVYRLENIAQPDLKKFAKAALYEEIDQTITFNKSIFPKSAKVIEVAYKPGVMNPEVASILKAAKDLNIKIDACDSSWEYAFFGKVTKLEIEKITEQLLVNKTIENLIIRKPRTLLISGIPPKTETIPIRKLKDADLLELSKNKLFLNLEEMRLIQNYFIKIHRDPTDCEIEILAQTWSEHCVHKTFKAKLEIDGKIKEPLIKRIKATAKNNPKIIISAFDDNSGVIDFYDGYAINGKVETHNSPSAIEPYGGAMTGSGGVFRDILGTGQGAKPITSTDMFCFAPPNIKDKKIPPGCLSPSYLLRHVVAGVKDYGNRVGIPTNNGSIHFHPNFRAKPTVAVGSYGLIPKKYAKKGNPKPGDLVLTIGGATGRDGIHGATFSSGEMTAKTLNISGSAVQIGNAIEEKRVIDAVLALRNINLIRAITDCGAGGYSSAIGEMGKNTGALVNLEKVPLKYIGLAPWEIFVSESQERMVLAIDPKNIKKVQKILMVFNVPNATIGKFTNTKKLVVKFKNEIVANLEMKLLHDGLPQRFMVGKTFKRNAFKKLPPTKANLTDLVKKVISHPNIASKEPILRLYDHNVQGTTALHPLGGVNLDSPNDGSIVTPILGKHYGLVVAHGLNPALNLIDPYWGSIWACAESVSNFVAVGGQINDAALIDNFIWPFPDEKSLADLDKSTDACIDFANVLKMPFVSGKDSLSSTYRYPNGDILKIPPVLLISTFGKIPDVRKTTSSDIKSPKSTLVLVGKSDFKNLGGSVYFEVTNATSPTVPKIDLNTLPAVLSLITSAINSGKILSIHDISEGGIAVALSEMCFGGDCGAKIDVSKIDNKVRADFILFSETAGTFIAEVESESIAHKLFAKVPHRIIGNTKAEKSIDLKSANKLLAKLDVDKLKKVWQSPMKEVFHT